jgi:hypothetical protein
MFVVGVSSGGASCGDGYHPPRYCKLNYCDDVDPQASLWFCKPPTAISELKHCYVFEDEADKWCQGLGGGKAYPPNCKTWFTGDGEDGGETGGGETGDGGLGGAAWDPGSHVTYDPHRGHYVVDAAFVDDLKDDWASLGNDAAYLQETSSGGYYEILDVARGDLAHAMGLQSGDTLRNVNGYDLGTLGEVLDAYIELYDETEFTLEVIRGSTLVTLEYVIVE